MHTGVDGHVKMEAEIEVTQLQAKSARDYWEHLEVGRGRKGSPPKPSEGARLGQTSILHFWPPEVRRIHFCCLKQPGLWSFVLVALRN